MFAEFGLEAAFREGPESNDAVFSSGCCQLARVTDGNGRGTPRVLPDNLGRFLGLSPKVPPGKIPQIGLSPVRPIAVEEFQSLNHVPLIPGQLSQTHIAGIRMASGLEGIFSGGRFSFSSEHQQLFQPGVVPYREHPHAQ